MTVELAPSREQTRARYPDEQGYVERDGVSVFWERYGDGEPTVLLPADLVDHPFAHLGRSQVPICPVTTMSSPSTDRGTDNQTAVEEQGLHFAESSSPQTHWHNDAADTACAFVVGLSLGTVVHAAARGRTPERAAGQSSSIGPLSP